MKKMHLFPRRTLAFLLAAIMLLGVVGCAKVPTSDTVKVLPKENGNANTLQKFEESALGSREELEKVVEVLGNGENTENMTDEEINDYVEELIQGLDNNKTVTNEKNESALGSREEFEKVVEVLGNGENTENMTDEEINDYVEELIQGLDNNKTSTNANNDSGIVNLGTNKAPLVADTSETVKDNDGTYDENGAMTKPFDEVYPELVENGTVKYSDESVLIKLNNTLEGKITEGMKKYGVALLTPVVPMEKQTWYEAKLVEGTDVATTIDGLRLLDEVKLVEYNFEIETANIDICKECFEKWGHHKNPYHNKQWHMHHCGVTDGLDKVEEVGGSSSVIVAVIDTGVDYDHEDLSENIWVNTKEIAGNGKDDDNNGYIDDYYGVNLVAGKGNGDDDNGHGTHVAGVIAAQNNNVGVVGIASNVKIMPIKAAAANGTLNQATIAKAVLYAYENGAEIINMSFGGTACSIAVQDALAVAYSRCVLVASAGNSGMPNEETDNYLNPLPNYPAGLTYVLGVMSVDENGVESSFSNWDAKAFNGVEYELYAPGEAIMSTLPNNQYGILSGTSMAAPTVSAIAAILRSEFKDRDMYPTKFIYGQLACTSDYHATCINPKEHTVNGMPHNLPQIVNLDAALTKLPKPEVSVQDFAAFDTEGFKNDKDKVNNGDGVIDAGETVALGLTLRNRWGMSEDTVVSINANNNGVADPYITFINPTVNYGSVGTYSTQDCGKIYTDELLTGWENPFYVRIAKDCPNDYRFTIYVTITCKNALDEADETVYTSESKINLTVRSGKILPSVIDEDMVLTADNLYIIPNSTVINEGVTVRVESGTHIQFWSDDANDPYASDYIAYLLVNGKFLVEGTKENPVYIYPSQLMDKYNVELTQSSNGYISLKYADITNLATGSSGNTGLYNIIGHADHCTFRFNYGNNMYYRHVYSGKVGYAFTSNPYLASFNNVNDSVFYKIGAYSQVYISGNADRCIFVECGLEGQIITLSSKLKAQNCVFLKNLFVDQTSPDRSINFTYTVPSVSLYSYINKISYREETGTTYIVSNGAINQYYLEQLGGSFVIIESQEEAEWIKMNFSEFSGFTVGIKYDALKNKAVWYDGTEIADFLDPNGVTQKYCSNYCFLSYLMKINDDSWSYYLYEIPGDILPTEITFTEYEVSMDTEMTYQITPTNKPVQLGLDRFVYESNDENVITVDENGLVTPVGVGNADVYVYSKDRAVSNYISFEVIEYVPLENIELQLKEENSLLAAGETLSTKVTFTPENTTRRNVKYSSSNENVATVDAVGVIYGVSSGTTTITATCEEFTASVEITVYVKAVSLEFDKTVMKIALSESAVEFPMIITNEGAEPELNWRLTDSNVVVIDDDKLIPKTAGTSTLVVKDERSGLVATCLINVSDNDYSPIKKIDIRYSETYREGITMILLENGELYCRSESVNWTVSNVDDFSISYCSPEYPMLLKKDGSVEYVYRTDGSSKSISGFEGLNIKSVACYKISTYTFSFYTYFVITEDGKVYAKGENGNILGVGSSDAVKSTAELVQLPEKVIDIVCGYNITYFHTENGNVYCADSTRLYPTKIAENIVELYAGNIGSLSTCYARNTDGEWCSISSSGVTVRKSPAEQFDSFKVYKSDSTAIGVLNGGVYTFKSGSDSITKVPGITNAIDVFAYDGMHYVVTPEALLCFNDGETPYVVHLKPLLVENLTLTATNLSEYLVLSDENLVLTFNKALKNVSLVLYARDEQVVAIPRIENVNDVILSSAIFEEGVEYTLLFSAGDLAGAEGVTNAEDITITFTYKAPETDTEIEEDTEIETEEKEPVIHDSVLDTTIERIYTAESFVAKLQSLLAELQINPNFYGNAILNPISTDTDVTHWLRPIAPTVTAGAYSEIPLAENYWGTTNERAIELQMVDYSDFITYNRLMYAPYLTEAPENTFPFVTSVSLINKTGEVVTTVGNEEVTFRVTFNRDMDTSIPLRFTFGSAYPYADYTVEGSYVDARTWEGKYTLTTVIENGNQFVAISNGCSATEDLTLQPDNARFAFVIDTTAAQALIMQGEATDTGINLRWTQDDFDTLMGYNVYRSTSLNGLYQRVNKTVIPFDTMEFFDDTVEPGVVYYYNFTVVKTDLTESTPSGKITIMSKDTMAPNIYHSPVYSATMGQNLIISADVTDNLTISYANLYFRTKGQTEWKTVRMNNLNDKYSAIIPASSLELEGLEYYIEAFDGVSYTYRGSASEPYAVTVKESIDKNSLGDVDGDGTVTNKDALILLLAISHKYNMTEDEFKRADLNSDEQLSAVEALRILHYVTGKVGSLDMTA